MDAGIEFPPLDSFHDSDPFFNRYSSLPAYFVLYFAFYSLSFHLL